MSPFHSPIPKAQTGLKLWHKLMLLAAFEILVAGFTQAHLHPRYNGVTVEIPANPGHEIV